MNSELQEVICLRDVSHLLLLFYRPYVVQFHKHIFWNIGNSLFLFLFFFWDMGAIYKKICIFCNATFKSHQSFRRHLCSMHNCVVTTRREKQRRKNGKAISPEASDSRVLYECPSCPSHFDDRNDLKNHIMELHVIKYICFHNL